MKNLLILLAMAMSLIVFPALAAAESVWVHDSTGDRMLDVQRQGDTIQVWDMTNGGMVVGQRQGQTTMYLDYKTGEATWINSNSGQMPIVMPGQIK